MTTFSATYSPEDNKLRLYASTRLDAETYARVKAAGFRWAPKQDLFFAPMWTPGREDLLIELAGDVGDEDTTLADRAEARAERFEGYSERRAADAERARVAVDAICEHIPLGQPILVGHHSEKHARRDAQRIENGMRKAVSMWRTSQYWVGRAAGAISHAKYKERPDVRARRIKGIEADLRKVLKNIEQNAAHLKAWRAVQAINDPDTQLKAALHVSNDGRHHFSMKFPLDKYPRNPPASQYEGDMGIWSALNGGVITGTQAADLMIRALEPYEARAGRWVEHYNNRLTYERAMLAAEGYVEPPKRATKAILPLLNYGGQVQYRNRYTGETVTTEAHPMTRAEYAAIYTDYKGTFVSADGTHRIRSALIGPAGKRGLAAVYLTDAKQHKPGEEQDRIAKAKDKMEKTAAARAEVVARNKAIIAGDKPAPVAAPAPQPAADLFASMEKALKAGPIKVQAVHQLFPTPRELCAKMVELANIEPGDVVLEPEAGTGALLGAMGCRMMGHNPERGAVVAVEINHGLCERLEADYPLTRVHCADFLEWRDAEHDGFDVILMNPPFEDGADIRHIRHARTMLKPGGVLVAICANGPRQRKALMDEAEHWEDLPAGTFKDQGTMVNTALLVIRG